MYGTFSLRNCLGKASFDETTTVEMSASMGQYQAKALLTIVPVQNKHPWPLENSGKGWPPSEPKLAANIMEDYVRLRIWEREIGREM